MFSVNTSVHTDVGDVKQSNQDSVLCKHGSIHGHDVGLYIVADGCGGLAYGEEVSNLIATYFNRLWSNELKHLLANSRISDDKVNAILESAIFEINKSAIAFGAQVDKKVGSTLSLLLTIGKRYFIKNIGDSRVYLKRKNKIIKLTEDQSLVADMIRNKELTVEQAKSFKKKNVLTMCIGIFDDIKTYSQKGKIKDGDAFVLCCDGLHNHVAEKQMLSILKNKKIIPEDKAQAMRNLIPEGEANDNVSVVLTQYFFGRTVKIVGWIVILLILSGAIVLLIYKDSVLKIIQDFIFTTGRADWLSR